MRHDRYSRRRFLEALGAGAALLPMLEADPARGASAVPRRLLIVMQTNGVIADQFLPKTTGDITGTALPRSTAPLNDFRGDLLMISGLEPKNFTAYGDYGAGHESFSTVLTGAKGMPFMDAEGPRFKAGSATVDQYVATQLARSVQLPFKSLDLAVWMEHYWYQARCFYKGADSPVNPEQDPMKAFNALFAGRPMAGMNGGGGAPVSDDRLKRLQAERQSLFDFLADDLKAFSARLGKTDQQTVQGHLDSIRELEKQVQSAALPGVAPGGSTAMCTTPTVTALPGGSTPNDNYPKVFDQHIDLLVSAFRCDVTRVATLMTTNANGLLNTLNWLDIPTDTVFGPKNYHGTAHAGGEGKIKTDLYFMQQFAKLLAKLKAVPEGNGTMLDNTVVLWANHMGNGGAHNVNDLPWIVAGKGGGYFKTGRYIRKNREPTNGVLKALCSAMNVDPSGFGDPQWGGEFADLRSV